MYLRSIDINNYYGLSCDVINNLSYFYICVYFCFVFAYLFFQRLTQFAFAKLFLWKQSFKQNKSDMI